MPSWKKTPDGTWISADAATPVPVVPPAAPQWEKVDKAAEEPKDEWEPSHGVGLFGTYRRKRE